MPPVPTLTALCVTKLARGAPPRALMIVLRRLPEELVMSVLAGMIASNTLTDDRLATFFVLTRRVLKLEGCAAIRNSILRQIPVRCPQLRCLDLTNCSQVTNGVVRAVLRGCPSLQTLRLDGCRHITDAAFQPELSPLLRPPRSSSALQVVSFARCSQLTDELVPFLVHSYSATLTDVNLSKCKKIPSDAIRTLLRAAPRLQRLNVSFMDLTDAAFLAEPPSDQSGAGGVASCAVGRALRSVDLTHCKVTDATLVALATHCRDLEAVTLSSCSEVTDAGVEALLRACAHLRELDLNNCPLVMDRGVAAAGAHGKRLRRLNLSWCMNITDKCIADLARGCGQLQEVLLVWCTQLTDAALDAFILETGSAQHPVTINVSGCKGISRDKVAEARRRGLCVT
ncbi:hypothetical protein PybrP1_001713 [[Pythium] brassicae (nom. inval.)]|nr:hypothetical protein PybrP1_001713 [[Pythium] brassicae (nom. inval.)]